MAASSTIRRVAAPAENAATSWIENRANELLAAGLEGIKRVTLEKALKASTTRRHNYVQAYTRDLGNVIDMEVIRNSGIRLGVDPSGARRSISGSRSPSCTNSI